MKHLKNKKGMTYIMVILILAVGSILVASMFKIALNEDKQAIVQSDNMKAYNIARAGADIMVYRMLTLHRDYWNDFDAIQTTDSIPFKDGTFTVSVEEISNTEFEIVSTGSYETANQIVRAVVEIDTYSDWLYGIFAMDSMEDIQLGYLSSQIGSPGSIGFKNPSYDSTYRPYADEGSLYTPSMPDYDFSDVAAPPLINGGSIITNINNEVVITDESSYFDTVQFTKSDQTWVIDTTAANFEKDEIDEHGNIKMVYGGSDDWMIIWIKGDASIIEGGISVVGDNNLMIIVEDKLEITGALEYGYDIDGDTIDENFDGKIEICVIDSDDSESDFDLILSSPHMGLGEDDIEKLRVNMFDDTQLKLDVNGSLYGHIFGPGAYVEMKNAQTELYGAVIAGSIDIDANVKVYYDPDSNGSIDEIIIMQFSYWD